MVHFCSEGFLIIVSHLPMRARGLFPGGPVKKQQTSEHDLFPPHLPVQYSSPLHREFTVWQGWGGGGKRVFKPRFKPRKWLSCSGGDKDGRGLDRHTGWRAKDWAPSCSLGWTLLGQPEVQRPEETALEINFKISLLKPYCYQRVTLGNKNVSFPPAGK